MDVYHMREHIRTAFPYGENWKLKVDKMSESQVIAVYHRMVKAGTIKGA